MTTEKSNFPSNICSWCGQPSNIIWVHGHGQCSVCGYNVDECCRGENCTLPEVNNPGDNTTGNHLEK